MNHWALQRNAFEAGEDKRNSVTALERDQTVVCPKPRRIASVRNPTAIHCQYYPVPPSRCQFSHQVDRCESEEETDILDMILKDGCGGGQQVHSHVLDSTPPFFSGSPPSRVANPLTQDARFREDIEFSMVSPIPIPSWVGHPPPSPSPSSRKGGCVRGNFGNSPAVRIEGFDCLDRDSRHCSIPALA